LELRIYFSGGLVVQLTKKRLGEILLDAKKISENDLLRALAEQKNTAKNLVR